MLQHSLFQVNSQQYQILNQNLGAGSFGEVHKGINVATGEYMAVKVATQHDSQIAINQVNILTTLNQHILLSTKQNQNIPSTPVLKLLGTYRNYNQFYIVTQFYGLSLDHIIQKLHPFNFKTALTIFSSIIAALQPLRKCRILHRDIKPANILVNINTNNDTYECKMCDFGLAKKETIQKSSSFQADRVGTVLYQSPQVIKFRQYSQKSEIWSLGVILFQLIYKKLPYQKQVYSKIDTLYQVALTQQIKFKNIPIQIAKLGQKCLATTLHKRLSFKQLKYQLYQIIDNFEFVIKQFNSQKTNVIKQKKIQKKVENINFIATALTASSYSDMSACQINKIVQQKIQEIDKFQINQTTNNSVFFDMLIQCYKQLHLRMNNIKKSKKQDQIKLLKLCERLTNNQNENEYSLSVFSLQVMKILYLNIKKIKLVCEYAQSEKQISFNLKQFMLADTMHIIYMATQQKIQKGSQNQILLREHLENEGQAKSMQHYKQLRAKIIQFG